MDRNNIRKDFFLPDGRRVSSLKLTINPNTLAINSAKKVNRYQTLTRWVEEHWGDEMDQVSFSGNTYSFMILSDPNASTVYGVSQSIAGLTNRNRRQTAPYEELRHFANIAQTNALLRHADTISDSMEPRTWYVSQEGKPRISHKHPRAGLVKERLYIKLVHDYVRMVGYFESFDVMEDANAPFKLAYNVNFKAEKTEWI